MALSAIDRLLTVAVTATLTSAAWIVILSDTERETPGEANQTESSTLPAPVSTPVSSESEGLLVPVAGVDPKQLSDTFDDARGAGSRRHEALDIPAPAGTPVVAAAPGVIESLFRSDDGGNTVYVRSRDRRTLHYYAHLQEYADGLREGQRIDRGQRLGTVGSSGNADPAAPHLHFAILGLEPDAPWWASGRPINPYAMFRSGSAIRQTGDADR